jgi:hypothetical protein
MLPSRFERRIRHHALLMCRTIGQKGQNHKTTRSRTRSPSKHISPRRRIPQRTFALRRIRRTSAVCTRLHESRESARNNLSQRRKERKRNFQNIKSSFATLRTLREKRYS